MKFKIHIHKKRLNSIISSIFLILILSNCYSSSTDFFRKDSFSSQLDYVFPTGEDDLISKSNNKNLKDIENYIFKTSTSGLNIDKAEINLYTSDKQFNGYNLFILDQRGYISSENNNHSLLITDMVGNIIIKKDIEGIVGVENLNVELINSTTILLGTPSGAMLWNFYTNDTINTNISGHHEYEYNPINNTIFTLEAYDLDIDGTLYAFDRVVEYSLAGDLVWSLDTSSFVSHTQYCPYEDLLGERKDITHANTIFFDVEEDIIYLNCRNLNTFYKINHTTGEVIWGLGEYGDFTLYNIHGIQQQNLFFHAHAVERIDKNTFILFDNDYHNQTNQFNKRSRILEITIDEFRMLTNESWYWEAPRDLFSKFLSDADRLPNGNRLGTFGYTPSISSGGNLIEVDNTGDIVWQMNFTNTDEYYYAIYRSERFNFKPLIQGISDRFFTPNENINITWETWYNFRAKHEVTGQYNIYLNGTLIEDGPHIFNKFWRPSNLSIDLGKLELGTYNLTLCLTDEANHPTKDEILIYVTDFHIKREGPENIELGQTDSIIHWQGFTLSSLFYNLTRNGTIEQSGIWNGEDIELDLNKLALGNHNIQLLFYYNTIPFYNDTFCVTIYPSLPPEISSSPNDQIITWNDTLLLSWQIFDYSPSDFEILVNGIFYISSDWDIQNEIFVWSFPNFDEGIYNITFIARDLVLQESISTVFITVISPSPPVISSHPDITEISWNQDQSLIWEIHGGKNWYFWKNGILSSFGILESKYISILITDWQEGKWNPGNYNLTLIVVDEYSRRTKNTIWLKISVYRGDAYADELVSSLSIYYLNGENALGSPDNKYTIIYCDYSNGQLILDMGLNEEIINSDGNDFIVYARAGNYTIRASNSLSTPFIIIGYGQGVQSFDLATINLDIARYIQIEFRTGEFIEVDAIQAINYNIVETDNKSPIIQGINDFWVWENQSSVIIEWEVLDLTPWNYTTIVNNLIEESGSWDGSDIIFEYQIESLNNITITLILFDLFGNRAEDSVNIKIRPIPTPITQKTDVAFSFNIICMIIFTIFIERKIRKCHKKF